MLTGWRVLGCCVGLAVSSGVLANESVYQKFPTTKEEIATQCKELHASSAEDRKRYQMAATDGDFLCTGYKTYKVLRKTAMMTSVQFGYLSNDILEDYLETFVEANTVGDTIEWRLDDTGVPRAAIIRFRFGPYTDTDGKTKPADSILVISKVGQPDNPVGCVIGLVNASRNKNANEIARRVADDVEPGFVCAQDTPNITVKARSPTLWFRRSFPMTELLGGR